MGFSLFVASKIHNHLMLLRAFSAHQNQLGWPISVEKCSPPLLGKCFSFHVICKLSDAWIAYKTKVKVTAAWRDVPYDPNTVVIFLRWLSFVLGCEPAILIFSLLQILLHIRKHIQCKPQLHENPSKPCQKSHLNSPKNHTCR